MKVLISGLQNLPREQWLCQAPPPPSDTLLVNPSFSRPSSFFLQPSFLSSLIHEEGGLGIEGRLLLGVFGGWGWAREGFDGKRRPAGHIAV